MFEDEMIAACRAMQAGDPQAAYRAYRRAHDLGPAAKRDHLAAHRGMITAAARAVRPDQMIKNLVLLAAAVMFDRGAAPTPTG